MLLSKAIEGFVFYAKGGQYSLSYIPTIESQFRHIVSFLGDRELDSIKQENWQAYFNHLREDYKPKRFNGDESRLSEATIDNHWKMIRSFYNWATDNNILSTERPDLKLPRPKYKSPQIVPFTEDECRRLLEAAQFTLVKKESGKTYKLKRPNADRDRAIIMILLDTGIRLGELCRLRLGDVNLENGEVYVRPFQSSKKSNPRTVFLGTRARQYVWKYLAKQQAQADQSRPLFDLESSTVRIQIARIGKNAKVSHANPHKFRHTFAINFLRNNGNVFILQRLLGHSTPTMTLKYLDISQVDVAANHQRASPVDNWRL